MVNLLVPVNEIKLAILPLLVFLTETNAKPHSMLMEAIGTHGRPLRADEGTLPLIKRLRADELHEHEEG